MALPKAEFQIPVMEYRHKMLELVSVLVDILSHGLPPTWGHPSDALKDILIDPSMPMRLLHYAPETNIDPRQFGGTWQEFFLASLGGLPSANVFHSWRSYGFWLCLNSLTTEGYKRT